MTNTPPSPETEAVFDMYAMAVLDMLGAKDGVSPEIYKALAAQAAGAFFVPGVQLPDNCGLPVGRVHLHDKDAVTIRLSLLSGDPAGSEGFYDFLESATCMFMDAGYILRGGVVVSAENDQNVAINQADYVQQKLAKFPRIVVASTRDHSPCVPIAVHRDDPAQGGQYDGLLRYSDGEWWFDFFRYTGVFPFRGEDATRRIRAKLALAKPILLKNLARFAPSRVKDPRVREKYVWLAKYYNEVAIEVGDETIDLQAAEFV